MEAKAISEFEAVSYHLIFIRSMVKLKKQVMTDVGQEFAYKLSEVLIRSNNVIFVRNSFEKNN